MALSRIYGGAASGGGSVVEGGPFAEYDLVGLSSVDIEGFLDPDYDIYVIEIIGIQATTSNRNLNLAVGFGDPVTYFSGSSGYRFVLFSLNSGGLFGSEELDSTGFEVINSQMTIPGPSDRYIKSTIKLTGLNTTQGAWQMESSSTGSPAAGGSVSQFNVSGVLNPVASTPKGPVTGLRLFSNGVFGSGRALIYRIKTSSS